MTYRFHNFCPTSMVDKRSCSRHSGSQGDMFHCVDIRIGPYIYSVEVLHSNVLYTGDQAIYSHFRKGRA